MLFRCLESDYKENLFLNKYTIRWDDKSASKFQWRVKQFLRAHFSHLEWFEECPLVGELNQLRFDFFCRFKINGETKCVAIESDGNFHISRNKHFAPTEEDYISSMERDSCKYLYCQKNSIPLLRIYEDDEPLTLKWFNETFNNPLPH